MESKPLFPSGLVIQIGLFPLGDLYTTRGVCLSLAPEDVGEALQRHARGDWGDVTDEDAMENERSVNERLRLFSVYHDRNGVKFWIITEADRASTTVLLPDEY